ncbi:MAG: hypothetical protein RLZZ241_1182 [Bacteroidota bacterium]|jgi:hypothetical protein
MLLLGCNNLAAQQNLKEFPGIWYTYFADYGINEKWSIHHETHMHLYEPFQNFNRFVMRGGANYNLTPTLTASVIYHYSTSDPTRLDINSVNRLDENRFMEQLVFRHGTGKWKLSHRIRVEQRYQSKEGEPFTAHRARYRFLANHTLVGPFYFSTDGEALAERQDHTNMSYRLSGALGVYLQQNLRFQLGITHFFLPEGRQDDRLRALLLFRTPPTNKRTQVIPEGE